MSGSIYENASPACSFDNILNNVALIELKENNVSFKYHYYSSTTKKKYMLFYFTPKEYN